MQKDLRNFLVLTIVILAIVAGVVLVKSEQDIRNKASGSAPAFFK